MLRFNTDFAYWIAVAQTDGCFSKSDSDIEFGVDTKSLPMLEKFRDATSLIFRRHCKIFTSSLGYHRYKVCVKQLLEIFKLSDVRFGDPPFPSDWIVRNSHFFGSYIAGVIDGDGDIRIKRPKYPQCVARISSGKIPRGLKRWIRINLGCSVKSTLRNGTRYLNGRKILGRWWETEFYVSKKNREFIRNYVLPYIRINHKREKLKNFIDRYN